MLNFLNLPFKFTLKQSLRGKKILNKSDRPMKEKTFKLCVYPENLSAFDSLMN